MPTARALTNLSPSSESAHLLKSLALEVELAGKLLHVAVNALVLNHNI